MGNSVAIGQTNTAGAGIREYWDPELETLPWGEVERWQARRIGNMLGPLRHRSRFYRGRLSGIGDAPFRDLADLAQLPFTLKDDIRAAQEQATDAEPFGANQSAGLNDIVQAVSSSGSTGSPLYYALTQADVELWTDAIANNFFTSGVRRSDIVAHLVGLPMVAGGLPYADAFRRIGATLCWLGGFPTDRILREMRRLRTSALLTTTSYGLYLAGQWDAIGRELNLASTLRIALCGGEPGLNEISIRARIMQGLAVSQLREVMGLGDVISAMWGECEEHDGMHFNAQKYVAIELIDPATMERVPWEAGATGEIVYTTFTRDATPLLRYRSRDHALVIGTDCRCGRTSPRIRCIGRTDDMLIYKGMNVFPTAIRDLILSQFANEIEPLVRIWKDSADQVRFDDPIPVDVEACRIMEDAGYAALADAISQCIRARLQVRLAMRVLPPGGLPRGVYKNSLLAVKGSGHTQ